MREYNQTVKTGRKMLYNSATKKQAAKYVVNNNMSVSEAKKKKLKEKLLKTQLHS